MKTTMVILLFCLFAALIIKRVRSLPVFKRVDLHSETIGDIKTESSVFDDDDLFSGDFDWDLDDEPLMYDDLSLTKTQTDELWQINMNKTKKGQVFESDIRLSIEQSLKINLDKILPPPSRTKRAARSRDATLLWKHNTIYYKIDNVFPKRVKLEIKRGIKHWKKTMKNCLKFVRLDRNPDLEKTVSKEKFDGGPVEHILFTKTKGCWSQVGRTDSREHEDVITPGQQLISIGEGCGERGTVIHEIGHAVGFWHEQSRRDRDKYVRIITSNIIYDQREQFQRMARNEVGSMGYAYDFWSIMHYGPLYFSKNGRPTIKVQKKYRNLSPTIGQRRGLSYLDVAQVRALYKCNILPSEESKQCISNKNKGRDYRGELDYTISGVMCQPWNKQYPHNHDYDLKASEDGLGKHNYCRNPGGSKERPWCYTTLSKNMNKDWEYCDLQLCNS